MCFGVTECCPVTFTLLTSSPVARTALMFCSLCCAQTAVAPGDQVLPLWAVLLVMIPIFVAGVRFIVVNRAPPRPY